MTMQSGPVNLGIVTIAKAVDDDLLSTISSVLSQDQPPAKYIIKTLSSDISLLDPCSSYDWIEILGPPDTGIYDAMNIGAVCARSAGCTHLLFLNSGDILYSSSSLSWAAMSISRHPDKFDVYFFPWIRNAGIENKFSRPSLSPLRFNHQATIYSILLHDTFGPYPNCRNFTTADYFFFALVLSSTTTSSKIFVDYPLSIIDVSGISSRMATKIQVYCINYLLGSSSLAALLAAICQVPLRAVKRYLYNRIIHSL